MNAKTNRWPRKSHIVATEVGAYTVAVYRDPSYSTHYPWVVEIDEHVFNSYVTPEAAVRAAYGWIKDLEVRRVTRELRDTFDGYYGVELL